MAGGQVLPVYTTPGPEGHQPWLLPYKSRLAALTPADHSSAPAPQSSPPAAQHGEGSRGGLCSPPPRRTVLPEPGPE